MKKLVLALSVLTLICVGVAAAQINVFVDDSIGIYNAAGENGGLLNSYTPVTLHVKLTGMTAPSVAAFEFSMIPDGPMVILGHEFSHDAINAATRPYEWAVGFGAPVPAVDGEVELMSVEVMVTSDADPASLTLAPIYFASLEGVPCYLISNEEGGLVEMRPSTGGNETPVFVFNGDVPVATLNENLDGLKSLYR